MNVISADPLENDFMNVVVSEEDEHEGENGRAAGKDTIEDGKFSKELFGGAVKSRWVMTSSFGRPGGRYVWAEGFVGCVLVAWLVGG